MKLLVGMALLSMVSAVAFANDGGIRCEFGKGECRARISVCPTTDTECRRELKVDCTGYEDGFLYERNKHLLIQGITTLRNPTPPAIVIETDVETGFRANARLFTSFGLLEGRCREGDNDS